MATALTSGDDSASGEVIEIGANGEIENVHVLVIPGVGTKKDHVFTCASRLPITKLMRYSDNGLQANHFLLEHLVDDERHDEMWDALEELEAASASQDAYLEQLGEILGECVKSYAERPTKPASSSRASSARTRRR